MNHQFEVSEDICCECAHEYCSECLVYSFGPNKPPFCISCALAAAGVRTTAGRRRKLSRRELKKRQRERKKAAEERQHQEPALAVNAKLDADWVADADAPQEPLVRPVAEAPALDWSAPNGAPTPTT